MSPATPNWEPIRSFSGPEDTGAYAFDGAGNVKAMGNDTFVYDLVSRLTTATIGGTGETYTYDGFGNMVTYAGRHLSPSPSTNRMGGYGALYDTAGNLTRWVIDTTTYQAAYDAFDKQVKLSGGMFNQLNAYTTDGERVAWRNPSTGAATVELRDLSGHVVREVAYDGAGGWKWVKDYVYRDGLLLASQGASSTSHPHDGGLRHYALDHLGSPRLLTNRGGEKLALFTMNAWGMDTTPGNQDTTERMRYTVHERDLGDPARTNDDVEYMHARNYPPFFARFASLDPVRGDAKVPQSWNMYSYVRNNPVTTLDPDGKAAADFARQIEGCVNSLQGWIDMSTNGGLWGVAAMTLTGSLADVTRGATDLLKVGEATGEAIGSGGSGGQIAAAAAGDTLRAAAIAAAAFPVVSRAVGALASTADDALASAAARGGSKIVASNGTEIAGFTRHGIDRAIGDGASRAGVKPEAVLDALRNRGKIVEGVDDLGRPFQVFHGANARVVVNPETGQIVSMNPLSGAGAH